jgi:DNA-binding NtrC family response regulator
MSSIVIIDDDPQLSRSFAKLLLQEGLEVRTAPSGEAGLEEISNSPPDLVILDIRLPGMNGLETFQAIHRQHPTLPVIIITAYGSTETTIEAMRMGAFDYIHKPFDIPAMLRLIGKGLESSRCMKQKVEIGPEVGYADRDAIIGSSQSMLDVYKTIGRVASTEATVLIRGESGTGKELVARAIYQHSLRAEKPFVVINCVAIPETLLESELFGYEKGSFTGAVHRRIGKIEQGNQGTVFLDEIGDMPLSIQAKILRLLQEKSIERLGGREVIPVDVRIIAASNRDLEKGVAEGTFRDDLYYRLNVVSLHLPPLRDRFADLPLLVEYFLERFSQEMQVQNPGMTGEGLHSLRQHTWPGNVRELANVLQKAMIFHRGGPIGREELFPVDDADDSTPTSLSEPETDDRACEDGLKGWIHCFLKHNDSEKVCESCLERFESILIQEALTMTGGNKSQAAKLLGLSRPTLHARIEKYKIRVQAITGNSEK